MHPLLHVLDQAPLAETESSVLDLHPIRQAAPERSRAIPFVLSLGLTSLLIYGMSQGLFTSPML